MFLRSMKKLAAATKEKANLQHYLLLHPFKDFVKVARMHTNYIKSTMHE